MVLRILKNKKAQNTAEYAILIAIVVGSVIAMQTYAQRTMQARIRDANVQFRDSTNQIGKTLQYEPYYSNSSAKTDRSQSSEETAIGHSKDSLTRKKAQDYVERTEYNSSAVTGNSLSESETALGF